MEFPALSLPRLAKYFSQFPLLFLLCCSEHPPPKALSHLYAERGSLRWLPAAWEVGWVVVWGDHPGSAVSVHLQKRNCSINQGWALCQNHRGVQIKSMITVSCIPTVVLACSGTYSLFPSGQEQSWGIARGTFCFSCVSSMRVSA